MTAETHHIRDYERMIDLTSSERHALRAERRSHDEFHAVVNLDLRDGLDPDRAAWLRRQEIVTYWLRELLGIRDSIETQTSERRCALAKSPNHPMFNGGHASRAYLYEKASFDRWHAKSSRLLRATKDRITECRTLIDHYGLIPDPTDYTVTLARLDAILAAGRVEDARHLIASHLEALNKDPVSPPC